jgi:hypothetical protein
VRDRVRAEIQKGSTVAQAQQAKLTAEFDARWGGGFVPPARFVELVYRSLSPR